MYSNTNGRLYDELLEKSIIYILINNPETLDVGITHLSEDYFYTKKCKFLYSVIQELYLEKENIDIMTVRNRLLKKTDGKLKYADIADKCQINVEYFSDIITIFADPKSIKSYCEDLKELYLRRKVKQVFKSVEDSIFKKEKSVYDIINIAQNNLFELLRRCNKDKEFKYSNELVGQVLDRLNEAANMNGMVEILSGYKHLDNYIHGFQKKELILVSSRPGLGKTSFALNLANNIEKANKYVAYFSLDNSAEILMKRMLAMESSISIDKLNTGQLSEREWDKVLDTFRKIHTPNIAYSDDAYLDTLILRNKCIELKHEGNLDCVIIDYLQLMHCNPVVNYNHYRFTNRQEEINEILLSLKEIAKELDVPIIVLYQLKRFNKRNEFSYNDSSLFSLSYVDLVLFLERLYNDSNRSQLNDERGYDSDTVTINIMKHKNGLTGKIKLRFDRATTKFSEIE